MFDEALLGGLGEAQGGKFLMKGEGFAAGDGAGEVLKRLETEGHRCGRFIGEGVAGPGQKIGEAEGWAQRLGEKPQRQKERSGDLRKEGFQRVRQVWAGVVPVHRIRSESKSESIWPVTGRPRSTW